MKRNGPLPVVSVTCLNASVEARRSGMTTQGLEYLPSASGSSGNGYFRRNTNVRSSVADRSSRAANSAWPKLSRTAQRLMLATASRASTGVLSWNIRFGRRRRVQRSRSASTT